MYFFYKNYTCLIVSIMASNTTNITNITNTLDTLDTSVGNYIILVYFSIIFALLLCYTLNIIKYMAITIEWCMAYVTSERRSVTLPLLSASRY